MKEQLSILAACSQHMQVEVFSDNKYHVQNFGKGKILSELKEISIEEYLKSETFKKFQRFEKEKENNAENGISKENNIESGLSTNDEIDDDIGFRFELLMW